MKYATILIAMFAVLLAVTFSVAQESSSEDGVQEQARQIVDGAQDKVESIAWFSGHSPARTSRTMT